MAYSSTDLLRDTMRAAGGLPALDPEIDDVAGERRKYWAEQAQEWFADSPSELLEALLNTDWHEHQAMHTLLEKIVAAAFAGDRISADMLTDFRRTALVALRPELERKGEELAEQAERNRGIERAA